MLLSSLLLSSSFFLAPSALALPQDPPAEESEATSSMEKIKPAEAAAQIKEALKSKEEIVMIAALEMLGTIPSKLITKEVAKALKIKKEPVQMAAILALRYNTDPSALDALLKARKEKTIHANAKTAEAYAFALGQHGNAKAIPALEDNLVGTSKTPTQVLKAKVLALGHIRHKDSVEAILDYEKTTIAGGRGGVRRKLRRESRGSLVVLTGTDQGDKLQAWQDWWYDQRKSFKMSKEEGELENPREQKTWSKLWLTPEEKKAKEEEAAQEKADRRKKLKDEGGTETSSSSGSSSSDDF
jgi:hypothetical protein